MRISKFAVPLTAVAVIALAVVIANSNGLWLTSGKEIISIKAAAGTMTPDDVKGWMSLQEVVGHFAMPQEYLYTSLGITPTAISPDTKLQELEGKAPFETEDVREVVRRFIAGEPAKLVVEVETAQPLDTEEHEQPVLTAESTSVDIKGRMTLDEIAEAFELPLTELIAKSGLPAGIDIKTPLKDLKTILPEFEVSQVRDAVAEMLAE